MGGIHITMTMNVFDQQIKLQIPVNNNIIGLLCDGENSSSLKIHFDAAIFPCSILYGIDIFKLRKQAGITNLSNKKF